MSTAKVIIKGENKLSSAVKGAKSDILSLGEISQKVGGMISKAFTVTAVIAAVKKLGDACVSCYNEFYEAGREYKKLALMMKDQSSYRSVIANIDKLAKVTLMSKGDIESMSAELAGLGKSSDEINAITEAAVYLSNVTGNDLNSSMTTLLNTYNGTTTQLKRLGIDTSNLTSEQLKNGAAVDLVREKFGALTEAMAEADSKQHLTNISNTIGDIKQQIGGVIDYLTKDSIAQFDTALQDSFSNIQEIINYVGAVIANFPAVAGEALALVGSMLKTIFSWDFLKDVIETFFQNLTTLFTALFTVIRDDVPIILAYTLHKVSAFVVNIGSLILKAAELVIEKIANAVKPIVTSITADILDGVSSILETIEDGLNAIVAALKKIGNSVLGDIFSIIGWVLDKIESALESVVNVFARSALGKFIGAKETTINLGADKMNKMAEEGILGQGSNISLGSKSVTAAADKVRKDTRDVTVNLGGDAFEKAAEKINALADGESSAFKESLEHVVTTAKEAKDDLLTNSKNLLERQFGPALDTFVDNVNTIVAPTLEEIATAADATNRETAGLGTAVEEIDDTLKSGTFLDKISSKIGSFFGSSTGATETQSSEFGSSVISSFTSSLGTAGEVVNKLATNMSTMGPLLGAIATAIEYIIEGFGEALSASLELLATYIIEPLKEVGRVLGTILMPVLDALNPIFETLMYAVNLVVNSIGSLLLPFFEALGNYYSILEPILDVVMETAKTISGFLQSFAVVFSSVLAPVMNLMVTIMKISLYPILTIISGVLEALAPVLKVFAKIFVTVTGTIEYVVTVLQHWVAVICNWLADLEIFGWHPFGGLRMDDPGSPGKYSSYIKNKWAEVDNAFDNPDTITGTTTNASTTTAVSSASYQGATQVTINIYQEAPIVGDGGMRRFAQMIREEFEVLDFYGVTV